MGHYFLDIQYVCIVDSKIANQQHCDSRWYRSTNEQLYFAWVDFSQGAPGDQVSQSVGQSVSQSVISQYFINCHLSFQNEIKKKISKLVFLYSLSHAVSQVCNRFVLWSIKFRLLLLKNLIVLYCRNFSISPAFFLLFVLFYAEWRFMARCML